MSIDEKECEEFLNSQERFKKIEQDLNQARCDMKAQNALLFQHHEFMKQLRNRVLESESKLEVLQETMLEQGKMVSEVNDMLKDFLQQHGGYEKIEKAINILNGKILKKFCVNLGLFETYFFILNFLMIIFCFK